MSREIFLSMKEDAAVEHCRKENVGVSVIEPLTSGGVRLVCMSGDDAELLRRKLKSHIIKGDVIRTRIRPQRPLW